MFVHSITTVKASTGFSPGPAPMCLLTLLFAAIVTGDTRHVAADEKTATSNEIRHADLSLYLADDGITKPIRTTGDWENCQRLRRCHSIQGCPRTYASEMFDGLR
jgi:hypothetical protein